MDSIFETLLHWTSRHPRKLLFSFLDIGGRETESYTYEAFVTRARAIAAGLRHAQRLQTGDRLLLAYPAGLEVICAFFGCAWAGLIPVPIYPPGSHEFQAAIRKMAQIGRDCGAAGVLTGKGYYRSIAAHFTPGSVRDDPHLQYVAGLDWIVTDDMQEPIGADGPRPGELLFLQYTSGSTSDPRGVMVTHANILHNGRLVADHAEPIAVSWLPQYHDMGLIGYYLYSALVGGTTYGFSPTDFVRRPALWFETIKKQRATASSAPNFAFEYCVRPGRMSRETLETADLSSLRFLMAAAEPVRPETYRRFLRTFMPCGLRPECFVVAYGLAENTLAVSSYGRDILALNRKAFAAGRVRAIGEVSEIHAAKQIISCGRPLGDVAMRIVDPERRVALKDGEIGEIWLAGRSKCRGYWNRPDLTEQLFHARLAGEHGNQEGYLRTGDAGFLLDGELYVCGRIKEMIVVRGRNYYPQEIEAAVEESSDLIRQGCVAAFEIECDQEPALAVVAEVRSRQALPDPRTVAAAVARRVGLEAALIALVAPRTIPKTSSGKTMRNAAKRLWLEGRCEVLRQFSPRPDRRRPEQEHTGPQPLHFLQSRYGLKGDEPYSLIEAGVDSLDLVVFLHEIKELLREKGAATLSDQVDVGLVQKLSIVELFRLAEMFQHAPEAAVLHVRTSLLHLRDAQRRDQEQMMRRDRALAFAAPAEDASPTRAGGILLTGGTGFFGPFLVKALLEQSEDDVHVLVRAAGEASAKQRLKTALASVGPLSGTLLRAFEQRVIPVCGDIGRPNLGLPEPAWQFLAERIGTIYHNAAAVNYLLDYEAMRAVNVAGTGEVLRLAANGGRKVVNYISTTFIFGWATKEILYEADANDDMQLLDFGYSQSKWAAEQIIREAARRGLPTRIFRPALISPSVTGGGDNLDIAIRLLAFMINHGIGVEALNQVSFVPADVAANNIVAISGMPDTIGGCYHVTRDHYANMMDVTNIIARLTGRQFRLFTLSEFVPEVIRRCTSDDLLFPLLDFLIGSVDSIAAMEFKRYDSSGYRKARDHSRAGLPDPSLADTVRGILRFMERRGLVEPIRDLNRRLESEPSRGRPSAAGLWQS